MSDLAYLSSCFNDLSKAFTFDDPKSKEDASGFKSGTIRVPVHAKRTNKTWEYKIVVPVPAEPNLTNGSIMEEGEGYFQKTCCHRLSLLGLYDNGCCLTLSRGCDDPQSREAEEKDQEEGREQ